MCGTADWEWEEDRHAYAPVDEFCMGCYLKDVHKESGDSRPGVTTGLIPTSSTEHARHLVREMREQDVSGRQRR